MTDQTTVTNPSEQSKPSIAEQRARIDDMIKQLKRQEAVTGPSGAIPLTPTAQLLDASGIQQKNVDYRYRWVSVNKAARRQVEGYVKVSESEFGGPASRGNLILMRLPREVYEQRLAAQRKLNRDRLQQHNRDVENEAEATAKYLRDNHGVNVKTEDILLRG